MRSMGMVTERMLFIPHIYLVDSGNISKKFQKLRISSLDSRDCQLIAVFNAKRYFFFEFSVGNEIHGK